MITHKQQKDGMANAYNSSSLNFDFSNETITKRFFHSENIIQAFEKYQFVVIEHYSSFEDQLLQNPHYSASLLAFLGGEHSIKVLGLERIHI